jgi:hypothetical protein
MRRAAAAGLMLVIWVSLTSCHTKGIIELSRSDAELCYQMLALDGELLTAATTSLDDYIAKIPADQTSVASTRAKCRDHLAAWDRLVKELYERYGVSEESYRLDVFKGRFMPSPKKAGE